jgi:hypothetical protein
MTTNSAWAALRNQAFRKLWIAAVISGTCAVALTGQLIFQSEDSRSPKHWFLRRRIPNRNGTLLGLRPGHRYVMSDFGIVVFWKHLRDLFDSVFAERGAGGCSSIVVTQVIITVGVLVRCFQ